MQDREHAPGVRVGSRRHGGDGDGCGPPACGWVGRRHGGDGDGCGPRRTGG